jgi:UDP-2,3-diacylglucosamine hydrolase
MHLKFEEQPADIERRERVLSFFRSLQGEADLLILNGDIFDLWYDWKRVIIKSYFPIFKALADLREKGCRIVLLSGNHDFWFGDFFSRYLGVEIHQDSFTEEIDGKILYVTHGDLHTSNDLRYHIFRTVIRTGFFRTLFSIIHPNLSLGLGKQLSRSSRKRKIKLKKRERQQAGLVAFAKQAMAKYDIIVMGHAHEACVCQFDNGVYLNSGEWFFRNTYVKIIDGQASLLSFTQS